MNHILRVALLGSAVSAAAGSRAAAQSPVYDLLGYPGFSYEFGERIDGLGDTDGDGVGDLIASGDAHMRVFSGIDGHMRYDLDSGVTGAGSNEGVQVSSIGDVDQDGLQDFIASGCGSSPPLGPPGAGLVRIFSGVDALELVEIWGTVASQGLGWSVDGCGDVTGDGIPDLVAGALNGGKGFVYSGAEGALVHTLVPPPGEAEFFAQVVAGVGDQDLDGIPDVAATSKVVGTLSVFSGADGALILHAAAPTSEWRLAGAGDMTSDGIPEVLTTSYSPLLAIGSVNVFVGGSLELLRTHVGTQDNEYFGGAVCGGQDIDGDGVTDYLATAYKCMGVQFGACSTEPGYVKGFSGATGAELFMVEGATEFDGFGSAVSFVGDVNGDQVSELAVGVSDSNVLLFGAGLVQVLSPVELPLTANKHEIGVLAGGTQILRLDAGTAWAGAPYLVAGTVSGIVPGFDLGTLHLPLNVDAYTLLNLAQPNGFPLLQGFGTIGPDGKANAAFSFGQGLDPALKGTSVQHIFVLFGPAGSVDFVSNTAGLWLF